MEHEMGHRMTDKAVEFQFAGLQDVSLVLRFIRGLADYEGMLDQVVAAEELLNQWLFEKKKAEMILGMKDGETVGFALFFYDSSIFLGRSGICLGGLYVRPEYRGQGFGAAFLNRLTTITVGRGYGRLEWWCLDRGKPSIDFYLRMGAQAMSDWIAYRVDGGRLKAIAVAAQG